MVECILIVLLRQFSISFLYFFVLLLWVVAVFGVRFFEKRFMVLLFAACLTKFLWTNEFLFVVQSDENYYLNNLIKRRKNPTEKENCIISKGNLRKMNTMNMSLK